MKGKAPTAAGSPRKRGSPGQKGQWKSIAKYYVPSRTATQVASHAQKHFLRVSGSTKRRSRFSAVEEATMATPSAPVSAARDASRTFPLLPQQQQQPMQQPLSLQPSAACVLGQPVAGSVVMGIPLGMPPWLPPPISQQAASLPILPVGPMSPAQELAQHAEEPSPPSSRDSRGTGSPARPLRSSGSSHGRASTRPRTLPRPTSRQQQLFRLLEMREQMHASSHAKAQPAGSAGSAAAALRGATPTPPPALYSTAAVQPQQPSSSQARSEHGSLAKRKLQPVTEAAAEPSVEQRQPAARPVPPLWGAMPEGLAMLAAAACNNGAGGEAGAKDLDGCHTTETDSETDTTGCERSTM
ncbi:hypothetical protein N2152v2_009442 [Parachlorella kessleri]